MRLASLSLIPDGVGHVSSNGSDGKVKFGGIKAMSLSVMMTFVSTLQHSNKAMPANVLMVIEVR